MSKAANIVDLAVAVPSTADIAAVDAASYVSGVKRKLERQHTGVVGIIADEPVYSVKSARRRRGDGMSVSAIDALPASAGSGSVAVTENGVVHVEDVHNIVSSAPRMRDGAEAAASGVAGASWFLDALAVDDLQSLAAALGIRMRGEDLSSSVLSRSASLSRRITATDIRQSIREGLDAQRALEIMQWVKQYMSALKAGEVTLIGSTKASQDLVDLSHFESPQKPNTSASVLLDDDIVAFDEDGIIMLESGSQVQFAGEVKRPWHLFDDVQLAEDTAPDTVEQECSICYSLVPRRELMTICTSAHKICRVCAIQQIRNDLQPGSTGVYCPFCIEEAKAERARTASADAAPFVPPRTATMFSQVVHAVHKWSKTAPASALAGCRPLADDELARFNELLIDAAFNTNGRERTIRCSKCHKPSVASRTLPQEVICAYCDAHMCEACGLGWLESHHSGKTCKQAAEMFAVEQDAKELADSETGQSFKRCPTCRTGITHYRQHGCHHITCMQCKSHWCYVCCGPHPCQNGCPPWCDMTCDCIDCPDCAKAKPCANCSRIGCFSCKGESAGARSTRLKKMTAQRAAKMATGWIGPRTQRAKGVAAPVPPPPASNFIANAAQAIFQIVNNARR